MNPDAERLLKLASLEPGYSPRFIEALLANDVYVIVPDASPSELSGRVQFVMWEAMGGGFVVPAFLAAETATKVVQKGQDVRCVNAIEFLGACRGATVVINPNEAASFRLDATDLEALLETGTLSPPVHQLAPPDDDAVVQTVDEELVADLTMSLRVFFSGMPEVSRATVLERVPGDGTATSFLLFVQVRRAVDERSLAQAISGLLAELNPGLCVDALFITPDQHDQYAEYIEMAAALYDESFEGRMHDGSTGIQ